MRTIRRPTRRLSLFGALALVASLAAPVVATTPASAVPPAGSSTTVVINEVATQGPGSAADEFVELRNISMTTQNIGGFQLVACNVNGTTTTLFTFPSPTVLARKGQVGQFRLVVNSTGYTRGTAADFSYTSAVGEIQATGGVKLVSGITTIDAVGFSSGLSCTETSPATPQTDFGDRSNSRNATSKDIDNNKKDFTLITPSTPANQFS